MKEQSKSDKRPFVMRQKHDFWSKIEAGANLNKSRFVLKRLMGPPTILAEQCGRCSTTRLIIAESRGILMVYGLQRWRMILHDEEATITNPGSSGKRKKWETNNKKNHVFYFGQRPRALCKHGLNFILCAASIPIREKKKDKDS
jgi:hypothetical protein